MSTCASGTPLLVRTPATAASEGALCLAYHADLIHDTAAHGAARWRKLWTRWLAVDRQFAPVEGESGGGDC